MTSPSQIPKEAIPEHLINIYKKYGKSDYIGENITQMEHALQSAFLAMQERPDDYEFILAALLHDIGHILNTEGQSLMVDGGKGNLGVATHEYIGSGYLRSLGFPERTCMLVSMHVRAKRYLASTNIKYMDNLSEASYKTMKYQGGLMNMDEAEAFQKNEYFEDAIRIRYIDDYAKKTVEEMGCQIPNIDYYKEMIKKVLE